MSQSDIAHLSGWAAFAAITIALSSGLVMMLPWHLKRKHSLGWHRTWTVVAVVAVIVHVAAQADLDRAEFAVLAGWASALFLVAASTHRWRHKAFGVTTFTFAAWHTWALEHHEQGGAGPYLVGIASFVAVWLLGARYTPAPAPKHAPVQVTAVYRWVTDDGQVTALTRWGLRRKLRRGGRQASTRQGSAKQETS